MGMDTKPKAKGKRNKPEPASKTTLAFREYERVSYYLATIGDFNFTMDDDARSLFFDGFGGDDMSADIGLMTMNRISPTEDEDGRKIPKGDHIEPGLATRTAQREKERTNQKRADSQFSKPIKKGKKS